MKTKKIGYMFRANSFDLIQLILKLEKPIRK